MKIKSICLNWASLLVWSVLLLPGMWRVTAQAEQSPKLTLNQAIAQAQAHDPWLVENQYLEQSLAAQSVSASTLPDPVVSLSMLNLPVDGYDFNQENMTQIRVGVSQRIPRGDTLALESQKLQILSRKNPFLRQDRRAKVAMIVSQLWLEIFRAKESIRLIEQDRALFEQLVEISSASYSTAFGGTQQQDVVRAQLELTRLEDRLTRLKQQRDTAQKQLQRWVSGQFVAKYMPTQTIPETPTDIDDHLPALSLRMPTLMQLQGERLTRRLTSVLQQHPSLLALENKIKASETQIAITRQKYKPQWGLNAAYSYRADTPSGRSRADFLSLGISVDVPLFTAKKQDKDLEAAVYQAETVKTQKWLQLRNMLAQVKTLRAELMRLQERKTLYQSSLLPQIQAQAEAALTAYTNDEGDFAEVVRSRIDVLDAEIDELNITIDSLKAIAKVNYYLVLAGEAQEKGK